ncbi:NAD(P) transhydrogenase subunit alpha [Glycomyces harbinensis]|uniref:proton-translocating NAD(P)(+) transhydrogenase n=1 Tax=Glycomyces harbinensis TaxID=58114 RepID=A0A1G6XM21_9ACTN|nr:NAD(P) transhydrogenase subunit alpha [Glycomyces harbinensis]SDD79092.1 NAD(P) transhydrogenase subunit alpha [Glycomyces harbinensis]
MNHTAVGVLKEHAPGERRVALVPGDVAALARTGFAVCVEHGAGDRAWFTDQDYRDAGAVVEEAAAIRRDCAILLCVDPPIVESPLSPHAGQVLIGMLQPLHQPHRVRAWARQGITTVSLDMLPRTLSRAQAMDALTSQTHLAGYRAVFVAAAAYRGFMPMLTTATGTVRPASVLVLGCGVAGLSAVGAARRAGAVVTAYDVRPEAAAAARSLGAAVLDLAVDAAGEGGYARALTETETRAQQETLAAVIGRFDIVIATAQVPGGEPPLLVTETAIDRLRPGAVLVDLAAGALGGNIAGSVPDATVEPARGVTLIGAPNLASDMAPAASAAYSRNVCALLKHLAPAGALRIDPDDEIQAAVLITHGGAIVHRTLARLAAPPTRERTGA